MLCSAVQVQRCRRCRRYRAGAMVQKRWWRDGREQVLRCCRVVVEVVQRLWWCRGSGGADEVMQVQVQSAKCKGAEEQTS
jgi:hypothetical protein